ncbi:hypothetical protein BV033_00403B, partial [Haemophilus influenzae]
LGKEIFPKSEN